MGTGGGRRKKVGDYVCCTCCGRTRSCSDLGIFTTDLSSDFDLADGTLTQMVLYCRDDSECRGTAQTLRLIPTAGARAGEPAPTAVLQHRVMRCASV
jgi:hypothetical protein